MKRREFIALLGSAVAGWPLAARAQPTAMPLIGVLGVGLNPEFVAAFRRGLAEAGYVPDKNVAIEVRWVNDPRRLPRLATELVDRKVDLIVTYGSPYAAVAAKDATSTIPIVFSLADDPVKYGLVTSLGRPGGNVTGMTFLADELGGKRLNLLLDLIPQANTIAYLSIPNSPVSEGLKSEMLAAGRAVKREIIVSEVRDSNFEAAFSALIEQRPSALIVGSFSFFGRNRGKIVELAARHKLPAMYSDRQYVVNGGLMSYAAGPAARLIGRNYVGEILKGAKPADLPVQRPNKFDLVINLKTAKALSLTVPPGLLAIADEVIE